MKPTYHIGLSMAGAVSAGAYTAGVLTRLFESINAWYDYKPKGIAFTAPNGETITLGPAEMPGHEISIEALSGASAGAMCTALLAVCLAEGRFDRLYDTWVNLVDLKPMLDTSDISAAGSPVYSLFNVGVIDKIADGISTFISDPARQWPSYLADQIDIYLTLTNLEGIPYDLSFSSSTSANQVVMNYADYRRFTLIRPGTGSTIPDDSILLDPRSKTTGDRTPAWTDLVAACVASGAFPGGLKPRTLSRYKIEYDKREWYFNYQMQAGVKPVPTFINASWAKGTPDPVNFQYVDGGVMNNEPFELVRRRLAINQGLWRNKTLGNEARSGVIMVDPFPSSAPAISGSVIKDLPEVQKLFPLLFGSLRNQALFSQDLLYAALDPAVYSRFLVAPSRFELINGVYISSSVPLASTILDAFGGFISNAFRNHDYNLGKRNCHDFLLKHFSLPLSNEIVSYVKTENLIEKYQKAGWVKTMKNSNGDDELHMQIIPVIPATATGTSAKPVLAEPPYPVWPKVSPDKLEELHKMAYQRFQKILNRYIDKAIKNWAFNKIVSLVADKFFLNYKWFAKKWITLIEEPLRKLKLL